MQSANEAAAAAEVAFYEGPPADDDDGGRHARRSAGRDGYDGDLLDDAEQGAANTPDSKKLHPRPNNNPLFQNAFASSVVSSMLNNAREQARTKSFTDFTTTLDNLRPYFDVETQEVKQRILWSLHPSKGSQLLKQYDLYVPLMLTLTLGALLLSGMKEAAARAQLHPREGATLVGTALATTFTYWLGGSALLYILSNATSARVRMVQVLCVTGYSLGGTCIILLGTLVAPMSNLWFFLLLASVGGVSAATFGRSLASLTENTQHSLVIGCVAGAMSLMSTTLFRWWYF